ncbi:hypothetical protein A3759_02130 [Thalassolituus sp. HI0120]|jgi:hypothetical protein|nr:hypothetical protein A3759_02130 [Thalassolituus sp. HI0120]
MQKRQEIQQKSRLGTLLIHKGLITRQQLDQALTHQAKSGKRLGEVLVEHNWITEKQLSRVLKKQSRYRLVAAVSAILLGPIQPFVASANAAIDDNRAIAEQTLSERIGLQSIPDSDLSAVTGQAVGSNYDKLIDIINGSSSAEDDLALTSLESLAGALIPGTNLLDADMEITGIEYEPGPKTSLNADGSLNVKVPTKIKQIAFKNVRVAGATGAHFGDVTMSNINLEGVDVKIRLRP